MDDRPRQNPAYRPAHPPPHLGFFAESLSFGRLLRLQHLTSAESSAFGEEHTRRQEGVKTRQRSVKAVGPPGQPALSGCVIENVIAALLGVGLLVYLVYALVRPEKF